MGSEDRPGVLLSRNPMGEDGGVDLYSFVFNNPINLVDPLRLAASALFALAEVTLTLRRITCRQTAMLGDLNRTRSEDALLASLS